MDVPVVLAIAGVVALLIGFLGGGIRARELEIPSIPTPARVIVSLGGMIFLGLAIWLSSPPAFTPPGPTALPVDTAPPPDTVVPSVTETPNSLPPDVPETPVATLDLPESETTFVEDFTTGSQYWETGIFESDRMVVSRSVVNGVFRWQVNAKAGFATFIRSKLPILSDFDMEVTLRIAADSEPVPYGPIFRMNDAGSYYFLIDLSGAYALVKWNAVDQDWIYLINWTKSTAVNLSGENKLRVHAVGSKIRLYINDILVADYVDGSFAAGTVDVGAWLEAGQTLALEMTSFKLVLPSP